MGLFSSIGKVFKKVVGGIAPVVGSIFGGIPGAIGTLGGTLLSNAPTLGAAGLQAYSSAQQQQMLEAEAQRQRDFNASQAGIQRDWAADQAGVTRQFNADESSVLRRFSANEALKARMFNQGEAAAARQFSAAQATRQMGFQERMANTAHQRQVQDLRKAGLNPILAATGGASSPGGAMASAPHASGSGGSAGAASASNASGASASAQQAAVIDQLGPAISTAMQGLQLESSLKTQKLQRRTINNETDLMHYRAQNEHKRFKANTPVDMDKATIRDRNATAELKEASAAEARASEAFWQENPNMKWLRPVLDMLGGASSAKSLMFK